MTDDVVVTRAAQTLRISLQRNKALNALSLPMIRALRAALEQAREPSIERVIIRGGTRAFCAGGDVRAVRDAVIAEDLEGSRDFFFEEYRLNYAIATLGKPWIAIIDGVCMGGGLGISVHGSHRAVADNTVMAMPEMAIGMVPDIGSTYFLARLSGEVGTWMALTGARVSGADAVALGLATNLLARESMDTAEATGAVESLTLPAYESIDRATIDRLFEGDDLGVIRARIDADTSAVAAHAREAFAASSPTCMAIALRLLREARHRSLEECFVAEYRAARAVTWSHDFLEGIRAVLVDKTRDAKFAPLDREVFARAFAPPAEGDWTPG